MYLLSFRKSDIHQRLYYDWIYCTRMDFLVKKGKLLIKYGYETFLIENNNKKVEVTNINYPL